MAKIITIILALMVHAIAQADSLDVNLAVREQYHGGNNYGAWLKDHKSDICGHCGAKRIAGRDTVFAFPDTSEWFTLYPQLIPVDTLANVRLLRRHIHPPDPTWYIILCSNRCGRSVRFGSIIKGTWIIEETGKDV